MEKNLLEIFNSSKPTTDLKKLGKNCAFIRKRLGYTQKQVADELGYSVENISAFENGRNDNGRIYDWYIQKLISSIWEGIK